MNEDDRDRRVENRNLVQLEGAFLDLQQTVEDQLGILTDQVLAQGVELRNQPGNMADGQRSRGANVPLIPFHGNRNEDFAQYIKQFELICDANNYAVDKRAQILASYLRDKAFYVYDSLTDAEKTDYDVLKAALREKFQTTDYRRFAHQTFQARKQHVGETVSNYGCDIHRLGLAALASIESEQRDSLIREKFLAGLLPYLQKLILYSSPKSFNEAMTLAERFEGLQDGQEDVSAKSIMLLENISERMSKLECGGAAQNWMSDAVESTCMVDGPMSRQDGRAFRPNGFNLNNSRNEMRRGEVVCYRCNRSGHIARSCPRNRDMSTVVCRICNRMGHFARNCQSRRNTYTPRVDRSNFNRPTQTSAGNRGYGFRNGRPDRANAVSVPERFEPMEEPEERRWQPLVGTIQFSQRSDDESFQGLLSDTSKLGTEKITTEIDPKIRLWCRMLTTIANSPMVRLKQKTVRAMPVLAGVLILLFMTTITAARSHVITPSAPMICQTDQGRALWKLPTTFNCPAGNHTAGKAVKPMKMMLFKRNYVQYKTTAWKCVRITEKVETFTYLFGDENLKKSRKFSQPVSAEECITMKHYKSCHNQPMIYYGGIYGTKNNMEWQYPGGGINCCRWKKFSVTNCYMYQTHVYKRHGSTAMESTAGDVSNCIYGKGQCVLSEGAFLLWDVSNKSMCSLLPWKTVSGKNYGTSWLSDDSNLALTFSRHEQTTDCHGNSLLMSDQGMAVRPDPTTPGSRKTRQLSLEQLTGLKDILHGKDGVVSSSQLAASLQALEVRWEENMEFAFSHALNGVCNFMRSVVELLKTQVLANPTMAVRSLTNQSNILARSGGNVIEIFPCTQLRRSSFRLRPMNGTCTAWLPIWFKINNKTNVGYLDPLTNIIHRFSVPIDCRMVKQVPVHIDGKTYLYNAKTGDLTEAHDIPTLKVLQWNIEPLVDMKATIFHEIVIYNWDELQTHISLNDIMGGLNRQREVLQQMGISSDEGEPSENADNAVTQIMNRGFFGFLYGLTANLFQVWTFLVCLYVTICIAVVHCVPINVIPVGLNVGNALNRLKERLVLLNQVRTHARRNHNRQLVRPVRRHGTVSAEVEDFGQHLAELRERMGRQPLLRLLPPPPLPEAVPHESTLTTYSDYTRKRPRLEEISDASTSADNTVQPFHINAIGYPMSATVILQVEGKLITAILDSGSNCSLVPMSIVEKLSKTPEKNYSAIVLADNSSVPTCGKVHLTVTLGKRTAHGQVIVSDLVTPDMIVGVDLLKQFGRVEFDFTTGRIRTEESCLPAQPRYLSTGSQAVGMTKSEWTDVTDEKGTKPMDLPGNNDEPTIVKHPVGAFAGSSEMVVHTLLEGLKVRTLIDTGSSLTIVPIKIGRLLKNSINHENIKAVSMTGHQLGVVGEIKTTLCIGTKSITGKVVVVEESPYELIAGTDVMQQFGTVALDFEKRMISFGTEDIPMILAERPADVFLCQSAKIPPKSNIIVMGLCYGLTPQEVNAETNACFTPSEKLLIKYGVVTTESIVQPTES